MAYNEPIPLSQFFRPVSSGVTELTVSNSFTPFPQAPAVGENCPIILPGPIKPPGPPGNTLPPGPGGGGLCGQNTASQWITEADDVLRLRTWVTNGPRTVDFYGRMTTPNTSLAPYLHSVEGNSPTVASETLQPVGKGCINSIAASVAGGLQGATVFLLAELGKERGGVFLPHTQLLAGQLTDQGIADMSTTPPGTGGGGGSGCCIPVSLDLVFMPASVAGRSDDAWSTPAPQAFKFRNCGALFDTTACAGPTYVGLGVSESGQDNFYVRHPTPIPAGLTGRFVFFRGGDFAALAGNEWTAPIPDQYIITGGGISLGQSGGDLNMVLTDPYYSREFYNR